MVVGCSHWRTIINNLWPSMSLAWPLHLILPHTQAKSTCWSHFITHLPNFCALWGILLNFSIQNLLTPGNFTIFSIKNPRFIYFSQKVSPQTEYWGLTMQKKNSHIQAETSNLPSFRAPLAPWGICPIFFVLIYICSWSRCMVVEFCHWHTIIKNICPSASSVLLYMHRPFWDVFG